MYLAGAGGDREDEGVGRARARGSLLNVRGDDKDENDGKPQAQAPTSSSSPTKTRGPMQYTYTDHAVHLSVQALPADMGCISVPLLGLEEVEDMFPSHSSSLMGGDGVGGGTMGIGNLNPFDPNTAVAIANLGNEMEGEAKEDNEEEEDGDDDSDGNEAEKQQQQEEERQEFLSTTQNCFREYIRPVPRGMLRKMFAGLVEPMDSESRTMTYIKEVGGESAPGATSANRPEKDDAPLGASGGVGTSSSTHNGGKSKRPANAEPVPPVRTITIRIRPDVLCGAVMDAVSTAVTNAGGEITKRRGGHLRCSVPGYWLGRGKSASRQTSTNELDGMGLGSLDDADTCGYAWCSYSWW